MKFIRLLVVLFAVALPVEGMASEEFDIRGQGTIIYVTDGDTFIVQSDSGRVVEQLRQHAEEHEQRYHRDLNTNDRFRLRKQTFVVRVGNIDTAESVHVDPTRNTAAGRYASSYAKKMLYQERVNFRCWDIGYYGRAICSVWNEDWEYGSYMISQGMTDYKTKYGRHPFFDDLYQKAQNQRNAAH